MDAKKKEELLFIGLQLFVIMCYVFIFGPWHKNKCKDWNPSRESIENATVGIEKAVVGLVICSKDKEGRQELEAAAVQLKSVMISAKLDNLHEIDFHMFLEYDEHEEFLSTEIQKFVNHSDYYNVTINANFHSALDPVPAEYREHMIYDHRFRCGYVRIFFPYTLPNVDSILYLDADTLVTGSISKLWENFQLMDTSQLVGIARNDEPIANNERKKGLGRIVFGSLPTATPTGVNTGVMLMNLTRMREFGWDEKLLQLYHDYRTSGNMTHENVINVLLYYNPGILKLLDCKFNFMHIHCDSGLVCKSAQNDSTGIHVVHGVNRMFQLGRAFGSLWKHYRSFNVQTEDIYKDLMFPIKRAYLTSGRHRFSGCYATLAKHLWKNALNSTM